jgi:hypothetical protein
MPEFQTGHNAAPEGRLSLNELINALMQMGHHLHGGMWRA